jgi:DNA-3-methyladenine glycosylase I
MQEGNGTDSPSIGMRDAARAVKRCAWAATGALEAAYHDQEWGVPQHDDRQLFEFLILEGAQAGLSWSLILKRRDAYRRAFAQFDPVRVARFDARRMKRLLEDDGIVRNRLKIESAVRNARAFLKVQTAFGSFDAYLWRFVDGRPVQNAWRTGKRVPASTAVSDALSQDLQRRGFNFVGSTICYAYMQAVGMVNDHTIGCFRRSQVQRLSSRTS